MVLCGLGSDGTRGLQAIKAQGGITFAEDEESAEYDEMPRSAIDAGCVDFELRPVRIAEELAGCGKTLLPGCTALIPLLSKEGRRAAPGWFYERGCQEKDFSPSRLR